MKAIVNEFVTDVEFRSDESEENDGVHFTCTLLAKFCEIGELSVKSVPEEHDAFKACNVEDTNLRDLTTKLAVDESKDVKDVVNIVINVVTFK